MSVRRLVLALLLVLPSLDSRIAAAEGFVEGHVLNARTGSPVSNAEVYLNSDIPLYVDFPGCHQCAARLLLARTDDSGFYSLQFSSEEVELLLAADLQIHVVCRAENRTFTTGRSAPVEMRNGSVRRTLYLDLPRRPRLRTCLPISIVGE